MIDESNSIKSIQNSKTHWQKFEVPFEFPVCFTEYIFDIKNRVFLDIICRKEKDKKHNMIFFIDEGIAKNYKNLIS